MIRKKVCMLGAFAVGKTSLVARFVDRMYSDRYETTVGVRIRKKSLEVAGRELSMVLWDIHGEDDFQSIKSSYLRGAGGVLLVADGTRAGTLDTALGLRQFAQDLIGEIPFLLLLNKTDLVAQWELDKGSLAKLEEAGWRVRRTSAKEGEGVEEAFVELAALMVEP